MKTLKNDFQAQRDVLKSLGEGGPGSTRWGDRVPQEKGGSGFDKARAGFLGAKGKSAKLAAQKKYAAALPSKDGVVGRRTATKSGGISRGKLINIANAQDEGGFIVRQKSFNPKTKKGEQRYMRALQWIEKNKREFATKYHGKNTLKFGTKKASNVLDKKLKMTAKDKRAPLGYEYGGHKG